MADDQTPETPKLKSFEEHAAAIASFRDAGSGRDAFKAARSQMLDDWNNTQEAFNAFKTDPAIWNGVNGPKLETEQDPAKPQTVYGKMMLGLDMAADIMGNPFRAAFMQWVMEKPYMREYLQRIATVPVEALHYDKFRAEMFEAFGQDLAALGKSPVFSQGEMNNTYVTRKSDGSWMKLTQDQVADLLRKSGQGEGPHVVLTANHAFLETMDDLSPITDQYRQLIDKVTAGRANVVDFNDPNQQFSKNDTIIVAATNTRENNYLNLAQLFHRLYEVDEANRNGPQTDRFEHCSPIAKTMVSTILKSIAEDPSHIQLDDTQRPPRFTPSEAPVALSPNAIDTIRRAVFMGFSKGGNDYRDGLRLLTQTLDSKLPDGRPRFVPANGQRIEDIISTVSVTIQSLNEKPMHPYYKEKGATTTYFSNRHDTIALAPQYDHEEGSDRNVVYDGIQKFSGHHPLVITENLSHPYIMQHHRCILAGLENHTLPDGTQQDGKPAIRFIYYDPAIPNADGQGTHPGLVIKLANGTSDAMMAQAEKVIAQAFEEYGVGHVRVQPIQGRFGAIRYELVSDRGVDDLLSLETIGGNAWDAGKGLIGAFESMRTNPSNGVIASSAITDPCLPTLAKDIARAKDPIKHLLSEGEDWKDHLVSTGAEVYDARIRAINNAIANENLVGPVPIMHGSDAAAGIQR